MLKTVSENSARNHCQDTILRLTTTLAQVAQEMAREPDNCDWWEVVTLLGDADNSLRDALDELCGNHMGIRRIE